MCKEITHAFRTYNVIEQKNVANILRRRGVPSRVASLRGFKSAEEGRHVINPKREAIEKNMEEQCC